MNGYNEKLDEVLDLIQIESSRSSGAGYEIKLVKYNHGDIKVDIKCYWTDQEGRHYKTPPRIKLSKFEEIVKAVNTMQARIKI